MTALHKLLTGQGAHARAEHILEGLESEDFGARIDGSPHTVFDELWHLVYWQDLILDWIAGKERGSPARAAESWPNERRLDAHTTQGLVEAFLGGIDRAVAIASDEGGLDRQVRGSSTVRTLLESLLAHNSHHLGKILLLRQLLGRWPPPSGGDTW